MARDQRVVSALVVCVALVAVCQQPHHRSDGVSQFGLGTAELLAPMPQVASRLGMS
jgi:hypothetical protein